MVLLLLVAGCSQPSFDTSDANARPAGDPEAVEHAIRALLDDQVQAWNEGNIEGFMQGYLESDRLRFASGGEVRYGWQATLERYRSTYPDREAMGRLAFEELDVQVLNEDRAMVFGRYRLSRETDDPTGLFTLILERRDEGWRIVHDHTSAATP